MIRLSRVGCLKEKSRVINTYPYYLLVDNLAMYITTPGAYLTFFVDEADIYETEEGALEQREICKKYICNNALAPHKNRTVADYDKLEVLKVVCKDDRVKFLELHDYKEKL